MSSHIPCSTESQLPGVAIKADLAPSQPRATPRANGSRRSVLVAASALHAKPRVTPKAQLRARQEVDAVADAVDAVDAVDGAKAQVASKVQLACG